MRLHCLPPKAEAARAVSVRPLRLPAQCGQLSEIQGSAALEDNSDLIRAQAPQQGVSPWAASSAEPAACAKAHHEGRAISRKGSRLRRFNVALMALSLAACTAMPVEAPTARASTSNGALSVSLNAMEAVSPVPSSRLPSNSELARDFIELSFALESGRQLAWFSRYEGPITIGLKGRAPATAGAEVSRLVSRLRSEAGINISTSSGGRPSISVEFVAKRAMNKTVPNTACFVVPNVASWDEYKANRRSSMVDWGAQKVRRNATVFIPEEASPQELRDCLHEETAQALGPLNDLFRLPDTVFNDDNFHSVLTRFDMMILKATYAPELRAGMSQPEVLAALASALPRMNPAGGAVGSSARAGDTPKGYVAAMQRAIGAGSQGARKAAAREAIAIAHSQGWTDTRTGFAYFALGRISIYDEPSVAVQAFSTAGKIYRQIPGAAIQAAHVDMQLAGYALATGQSQDAIGLANRAQGAALAEENSALMATLALIRASAYDQLGARAQASEARAEAQSWARYGFGSGSGLKQRATEVAELARAGARLN